MVCNACGKQNGEDHRSCTGCGASLLPVSGAEPIPSLQGGQQSKGGTVDVPRIVLGIALVLCALVPYLYQPDLEAYYERLRDLAEGDLYTPYQLNGVISTIATWFGPLICFPASASALIAGVVLLQGRRGSGRIALACGTFQMIYGVVFFLSYFWFKVDPRGVLMLFSTSDHILDDAVKLLRQEPGLFSVYWDQGFLRLGIAILVTAGIFMYRYLCKKQDPEHPALQKSEKGAGALMALMPLLALLHLGGYLIPLFLFQAGGNGIVSDYALATSIVSSTVGQWRIFLVIAAVALGLLLRRVSLWKLALAEVAALVLIGAVLFLEMSDVLYSYGYPQNMEQAVMEWIKGYYMGIFVMLVAVVFWITTSARGQMPLHIQIPLGILAIFLFAAIEAVNIIIMELPDACPRGYLLVAFVIVLVNCLSGLWSHGSAQQQ